MWGIFIGEITNPLIVAFDILRTTGTPECQIKWLAQVFGGSFVLVRLLLAPIQNIRWQADENVPLVIKISSGSLIMLGLCWLVLIVEKVYKVQVEENPDDKSAKQTLKKIQQPMNTEKVIFYSVCLIYSFAAILIY